MSARIFIIATTIMVVTICNNVRSQINMPGPPISGQVFSQARGGPVGGVTVSLVNPMLGRSVPVFSQPNGYYFFTNVPAGQTYYIEAYWGNTLLFRGTVPYQGYSIVYNIPLP